MNPPYQTTLLNYLALQRLESLFLKSQQDNLYAHLQHQISSVRYPYIIRGSSYFYQPIPETFHNTHQMVSDPCPDWSVSDSYKTEYEAFKVEASPFSSKREEIDSNMSDEDLRRCVIKMVHFILNEFGRQKAEEIERQRNLYRNNPILLGLFDKLVDKFSASAKCREDMVRFVLRKAISSLRDNIRSSQNLSAKAASLELCKRYFKIEDEESIRKQLGTDDEDELLNFLLPYKKNSRNKTANTRFMTEIFASKAFHNDYKEYLRKFDEILEHENQKKTEKFVEFLVQCVQRDSLGDIKKYKRLPWLKMWLQATNVIAYELLNTKIWKNAVIRSKKVKVQKPKQDDVKLEELSTDS